MAPQLVALVSCSDTLDGRAVGGRGTSVDVPQHRIRPVTGYTRPLTRVVESPGNATLHARAPWGTNHSVLGVAVKRAAVGAHEPSARESRLVQGTTSLAPLLTSLMVKCADGGIRTHAVGVVTIPRSRDHKPPGVRG